MEALSQLSYSPEAAPRRPACDRAAGGQQFMAGLVRAYVIPARVVRLIGVHACGVINWHARSPVGGAPQGWQDSNPRHAVLEAAVLAAELHPYETENRPLGVTLRAAPGPGLLIVAVTQLPPHGSAAHYYPGQL
jgi:hypothetical protein